MKAIDKCLVILQKTNDGDALSPLQLKLVELAVNGALNEKGLQEIDKLYQSVVDGTFKTPYYHNVEFMTRDHEGYVYFKGQHVEHYSNHWAYSLDAKESLIGLQQHCLFLEEKGIEVNSVSCVWGWDKYVEEFGEWKKTQLDELTGKDSSLIFSRIGIQPPNNTMQYFLLPGTPNETQIRDSSRYRDYMQYEDLSEVAGLDVCRYSYGTGQKVDAAAEQTAALSLCFDYLLKHGHITELARQNSIQPEYGADASYIPGESDLEDEEDFER